jgi:FtsZ-binding cell division protein ZapB
MQASPDMKHSAARLEEELQKKEDTTKQQEQYISQLEAKRDDLTSDNEKVKNEVSTWRCIILRNVLGFKDWVDVPMRDQELHQLLNNGWPPLHKVQQQALIVLDNEDSGFRQDAAFMALSTWGKASMEYPNLGLDDIVKFATALPGGSYKPSVLAFSRFPSSR